MNNSNFLKSAIPGLLCPILLLSQPSKPNVIYILCDDLGYGELGFNGQHKILTPELDELAYNGLRFTNHYCGNAVSAASRCVLMTGKHPGHAIVRANSPGYPEGQFPLPADTETLGKLMQRAGYTTACIGKWGLGAFCNSGNPNKQGFDYFFGYTDQIHAHNYYPEYLWRNGERIFLNTDSTQSHYSHDLFTNEALRFVESKKDTSFFLYLAYTIPHLSYQVPDLDQYKSKDWPEAMKIHAAMTTRMDRDVGSLVRLLRSLGIDKNTLILFGSDNGAHGQCGSLDFFKTSGSLRNKKRSMYEGGIRSPSFAYWPDYIKAGEVTDHLSSFWDVLPTLSELTGEPIKGETDGISFLPILLGNNREQQKHRFLYWELYEGRPRCGVRYNKWKAVVQDMNQGWNIELYDLETDEGELKNIANLYPDTVTHIKRMMIESHIPNPYWEMNRTPSFNLKKACEDNGVELTRTSKQN